MPVFLSPINEGRPIVMDKTVVLIGRHPGCDVILQRSRKVSRKHCCLARSGDRLLIRDLGSLNGVWVNGERIQREMELRIGDEISIGDLQYRLERVKAEPKKNGKNGRPNGAKDADAQDAGTDRVPPAADLSQDVPVPIDEDAEPIRLASEPAVTAPDADCQPSSLPDSDELAFPGDADAWPLASDDSP